MEYLYVLLGLALLFVGGEALVRGSVTISQRLGISAVLIGVVVVGFGTSTPELIVSVQASLQGQPEIALGNIVGSNIANVLLILGVAALITPILCTDSAIKRDAFMVLLASLLMWGMVPFGVIGRGMGALMIAALIFYIYDSYRRDQNQKTQGSYIEPLHEKEANELSKPSLSLPKAIVFAVGGMIVLMIGAHFLVDGATALARQFGISEAIIGLTLVAVGTSLPELAASIVGALRKQTDVIIGNILGSNLFNILSILGITSVIKPIPIDGRIATLDIPIMVVIAALSLVIILWQKKFARMTGGFLLILYGTYVLWMFGSGLA